MCFKVIYQHLDNSKIDYNLSIVHRALQIEKRTYFVVQTIYQLKKVGANGLQIPYVVSV